jgi:hypothetical protein
VYTYQAKETIMSRKRAAQSVRATEENPELNVSAEELARMHPLVRMALDFVNRDGVETTTRYDAQGNVVSVQRKVKKCANRARTFHSLLNAVRPVIQLEQEWLASQPKYDLEGTATDGAERAAITTPYTPLYSDIMSVMGYGQPVARGRDAKSIVDGSSGSSPRPPRDVSPDFGAEFNYYNPPEGR